MLSYLCKCSCILSLDVTNHLSLTPLIKCSLGATYTFPLKTLLLISSNLTEVHINPILLISPITWDLLITQHSKCIPPFLSSQPHIAKPMSSSISSLPCRIKFKYLNFLIFGIITSMVASSHASSFLSLDVYSKYSI